MPHGNLLTAILWSAIPAIILLAGIYYLDRYEKEPARLIAIALGAGAIVAPVLTAWIQKAFDVPNSVGTSQAIVIPEFVNANQAIIEEIVLGLVMLGVFFIVRYELDDLLDGLVYGAVVGVGFGMAANFWIVWTTPDLLGGPSTHSLASTVVSSFNWVFYAGVIGLFLGFARRGSIAKVLGMAVA
ncbi:MAG TPA: PrsW family glutamic-type intramembrane protease, partial [Actinomycetota bacterium]|nr:PrsW family glutamic-type intramembrane protease [Actinomycetota bacterium]